MSPSLPAIVAVSLALGVRHAFEPDHLAAVSTLATRRGKGLQAVWLGLSWGLGHTASVGVVALLMIAGGLTLPARLWPAADAVVGLLLVATVPTAGLKLAYVAAFGAGTILGMLLVSLTLVTVIRIASRRGERWATVMHLGSAVASVAVGVLLVGRIVTAL